jgi:pilus assembly protein CpaB
MKPARLIVLIIAIGAGGVAALLAGRSDPVPPPPEPVVQLETTEVLVANAEIGMGYSVSPQDLR